MDRARTDRQRGSVLIAIAAALVIVALAFFAVFALQQSQRKLNLTTGQQARLARLDAALAQFVARNRRLPCPADGTLVRGDIKAGVESPSPPTGVCNPANQIRGTVPWATLNLTEDDGLDAWNSRISYRVQPSLASSVLNLMNMSWCTQAGATNGAPGAANACQPAPCVAAACMDDANYLYGKGLQVQDGSGGWLNQPSPAWAGAPTPPPLSSGAAYVLIAHGPNGSGAFGANGGTTTQTCPVVGPEMGNCNGVVPLNAATIYIDQPPVDQPGATYFDDTLSHPTLATVLERAALGPRAVH